MAKIEWAGRKQKVDQNVKAPGKHHNNPSNDKNTKYNINKRREESMSHL